MIALPLRSSSTPSPLTLPSAWSTPGAVRTRSSSEDGIVGGDWKSSSTATLAVTVTSTPFWARSNRSLNEASIVSVNTNVPATKATPSTTAKPVRTVRSLRAQSPRMATRSTSGHRLHQVEHALGVLRLAVVDDLAIAQHDDPVGVRGGRRVVGDHDHRLAEVVRGVAQELQDLLGGLGIQVAGRHVGEHHGRA